MLVKPGKDVIFNPLMFELLDYKYQPLFSPHTGITANAVLQITANAQYSLRVARSTGQASPISHSFSLCIKIGQSFREKKYTHLATLQRPYQYHYV